MSYCCRAVCDIFIKCIIGYMYHAGNFTQKTDKSKFTAVERWCNLSTKRMKSLILILVVLVVVIAAALGIANKVSNRSIEFPYSLEGGKLVVNSLFQASVENPDCNNEIGENIASLEIINQSEKYCEEAEFSVKMKDGSEYTFKISDIPAGKSVWAFDLGNQPLALDGQCVKINCDASFDGKTEPLETVEYEVNDTVITIRNVSEQNIDNLSVYYHCLFDEAYYGGKSYCQSIKSLPAGQEIQLQTDECYMGVAEVVNIVKE